MMTGLDRDMLTIDSDVAEISTARRFVRRRLADRVPSDVSSSLQLIVSELVSNAVEHNDAGSVMIAIDWQPGDVSATVRGGGRPSDVGPVNGWEVAPNDAVSGRGLGIVRRLADRIDVDQVDGELVVTAHLYFDPRDR